MPSCRPTTTHTRTSYSLVDLLPHTTLNSQPQGKNVVAEASRALTKAMWAVGPHVLTLGQKAEFAANWVGVGWVRLAHDLDKRMGSRTG